MNSLLSLLLLASAQVSIIIPFINSRNVCIYCVLELLAANISMHLLLWAVFSSCLIQIRQFRVLCVRITFRKITTNTKKKQRKCRNLTENLWCAASALLFHLNDYSTAQINYFNVYIFNVKWFFSLAAIAVSKYRFILCVHIDRVYLCTRN